MIILDVARTITCLLPAHTQRLFHPTC